MLQKYSQGDSRVVQKRSNKKIEIEERDPHSWIRSGILRRFPLRMSKTVGWPPIWLQLRVFWGRLEFWPQLAHPWGRGYGRGLRGFSPVVPWGPMGFQEASSEFWIKKNIGSQFCLRSRNVPQGRQKTCQACLRAAGDDQDLPEACRPRHKACHALPQPSLAHRVMSVAAPFAESL